jgi:glucose 1-dehydrogenase/3-oxoacyl-[acyl-carrier protein] reductase
MPTASSTGTAGAAPLAGKLLFVTGSGTGIGQGIALAAAQAGADVVLHYASSAQGALDAVAAIQALGRRATAFQADLSVPAECRRVVDQAAAFLGGLDGLVNNAGVTSTIDFLDVTEAQYDKLYNLNIRGQFFCAQQAVRHMQARRAALPAGWSGSIVNISSVHAIAGYPGHSVYAGTKGAIVAFSRELAIELIPQRIRVNVLAPGSVEVPSYYQSDPNYSRALGDSIVPWGRVGLPADIGHAAVFMLGDGAEFLTGQTIYMDGGLTAKMCIPYTPPQGER